jgi:N-glycosidase YbiA
MSVTDVFRKIDEINEGIVNTRVRFLQGSAFIWGYALVVKSYSNDDPHLVGGMVVASGLFLVWNAWSSYKEIGMLRESQRMLKVLRTQTNSPTQTVVQFYDQTDPSTEWLGNFYSCKVEVDGRIYPNSEAAFQAQKFTHNPDLMDEFTRVHSGDEAFHLAQAHHYEQRADWLAVNVETMKMVLRAKIGQHRELKEKLLATNNSYINEHNPQKGRDAFWSDDHDGSGQNMLGQLWMQIRAELGGAGIVPKPDVGQLATTAQKTQKTADVCLMAGCSKHRQPEQLFCGRTHGQQYKAACQQKKKSGPPNECIIPDCTRPRSLGFPCCGKTHGQIAQALRLA